MMPRDDKHRSLLQPPPWWLLLLALAADLGTGAWRLITATHGSAALFFGSLVWPGVVIALVVGAVAWLGWTLDLE